MTQGLVGICSYLLVNFWYTRIAANQSSISALLTNRVGDCFLTIGIFGILWSFGKNTKMFKVFLAFFVGRPLDWVKKKNTIILPYRQVRWNSNSGCYLIEKINPFYVTGFLDAESSFIVNVFKQNNQNWTAVARFKIKLHSIDLPLFYKIQSFFGGIGRITVDGKLVTFRVSKIDHIINVIIPHFDKYPLESAKSIDFQLWKQCAILIKNKKHLTEHGLLKILSLKSALNLGLSETLKVAFPNIIAIERPAYEIQNVLLNLYWVSGFVDGDGSFTASIEPTTNYVSLRLTVGLHHREHNLTIKILEYFGVGRINLSSKQEMVYYTVGKVKDLTCTIIPHFYTYTLLGNKSKNYLIWREILLKVKSKAHLTKVGSIQIKELRSKLNKISEAGDNEEGGGNNTNAPGSLSLDVEDKYSKKYVGLPMEQTLKKIRITRRSYSTKSNNNVNYFVDSDNTADKNQLSPYLAGLIEGDGHIAVHDKNSKSKKFRPKIIVVFNLADKPLAEKLSAVLKVGKVISKPSAGHVILQILAKEEVLKVINLINGYMRTPKIEALYRAINWINENYNSSIVCLGLDESPIDSNSWLAGFTDADSGGFYLSMTINRRKSVRFTTQFKLKIREVYPLDKDGELIGRAYFSIFSKICEYFKTSLISRIEHSDHIRFLFLIIVHNPHCLDIVMEYFEKFPLLGKKAPDFLYWREVILKIRNKEHLQHKGLLDIKTAQQKLSRSGVNKVLLDRNLKFYISDLHLESKRGFAQQL